MEKIAVINTRKAQINSVNKIESFFLVLNIALCTVIFFTLKYE